MTRTKPLGVLTGTLVPLILLSACFVSPIRDDFSIQKAAEITQQRNQRTEEAAAPIVMRPLKSGAPERLLILFPGMNRSPEEYLSLAREIQESSAFSLWIGILAFTGDIVNPVQDDAAIERVFATVRDLGFTSVERKQTTLAGHSVGGIIAQNYIKKKDFAGLVLLSSYLVRNDGRSTLPEMQVPVLTLTGELDGQTRVTRIALDAKSFFEIASLNPDVQKPLAEKPVVVLPGVNHAQFADGKQLDSDLEPELDLKAAQSRIAEVVSDFIVMNASPDTLSDERVKAFDRMTLAVQKTREIVEPYWEAQEKDELACGEAQAEEAKLLPPGFKLKTRSERVLGLAPFAASKPKIQLQGSEEMEINISYHLVYPHNFLDISNIPESARALSCKTKSREAIHAAAGIANAPLLNCADLNRKIFNWALNEISPTARERFMRRGRTMVFGDDREFASGIQWLPSKLNIEENPDSRELKVTSTALRSGLNAPAPLAGMHYCKLLPPTQAMEWILLEGLRD
ncbi:MAG: alpha/beta hydrolase [Silvanigrellaceae bacterium]